MKRIVSGITPSGDGSLHIGNYLGAVKQFVQMAKAHECFLFVADYHALTTIQNKKQLQNNVETLILNELALLQGFLRKEEFDQLIFYRQSDIGLHPELQTIINNVTPFGLLKRAHAYKDKLQKDVTEDEINLGLFNYPILMAADILIYKPDLVPVGNDQKQHIEIARDIAERFNKTYTRDQPLFKLPEGYIPKDVATILGTDGKRKMSKSIGNIISIFESEEVIKKQVMSCYTDPTRIHADDPGHIEGNMVFAYLDFFGDPTSSATTSGLRGASKVEQLKELYKTGKVSDVEVKEYLLESLLQTFAPARKRYQELKESPGKVKEILESGAAKAREVASQTMKEVRDVVGLTNRYSFQSSAISRQTSGKITIDEFARLEQRVGKVIEAANVPNSEKLIKLSVNFGKLGMRTIFTGVREFGYAPADFLGKQFLFITNLLPRRMLGEESQGMILAVDGEELPFGQHGEAKPIFVSAEGLPVGAKVR